MWYDVLFAIFDLVLIKYDVLFAIFDLVLIKYDVWVRDLLTKDKQFVQEWKICWLFECNDIAALIIYLAQDLMLCKIPT